MIPATTNFFWEERSTVLQSYGHPAVRTSPERSMVKRVPAVVAAVRLPATASTASLTPWRGAKR